MDDDRPNLHELITGSLAMGDNTALVAHLANARAADIAECFDLLKEEERSQILYALPSETAAEIFVLLGDAVRGDVAEDLSTEKLSDLVEELPADDAAEALGELSKDESHEILERLPEEKSEKIEELLEYAESTAGRVRDPDVVKLPDSATIGNARDEMRAREDRGQLEEVEQIYLVSEDGRLTGAVELKQLILGRSTRALLEVCDPSPVAVTADEDQETVLQIIRKYDVAEAAVVDDQGRLIGKITHDDLQDIAEEEAEEDILLMAGTDPAERDTTSPLRAAGIRLKWLLPCMAGMLVTASVMVLGKRNFPAATWGVLVFFVPMLGAMGGNSGIQTSTIVIRGIATGELASSMLGRVLLRELRIALALAAACGVAAWMLVSLAKEVFSRFDEGMAGMENPGVVALAVGLAMPIAILVAALLGIVLPFAFQRLRIDPAIASGPVVTTLNDVISVSIYLTMATLIT